MFGCVVAGRLLQTNLQQIDETHAIFELPAASSINHICVFLLGTVPFPDGYGATVHLNWPGKGFQLLGMLSNEKPSAIFRLRGTFTQQPTLNHTAFTGLTGPMTNLSPADVQDVTAILGISVEPLDAVQNAMSTLPASLTKPPPKDPAAEATLLAERVVRHLFNYLSSFAADASGSASISPTSVVQLGWIQRWYASFLSKIRAGGVGFLERQD